MGKKLTKTTGKERGAPTCPSLAAPAQRGTKERSVPAREWLYEVKREFGYWSEARIWMDAESPPLSSRQIHSALDTCSDARTSAMEIAASVCNFLGAAAVQVRREQDVASAVYYREWP